MMKIIITSVFAVALTQALLTTTVSSAQEQTGAAIGASAKKKAKRMTRSRRNRRAQYLKRRRNKNRRDQRRSQPATKAHKEQSPLRPTPGEPAVNPNVPSIPELSNWEQQMTKYGQVVCDKLRAAAPRSDDRLANTYYDGAAVFYQISFYTKDAKWRDCAQEALHAYRDEYVIPNGGRVPGYWAFNYGMALDYLTTGDQKSYDAAVLLAAEAAYHPDSTPLPQTQDNLMSREVAYAINNYVFSQFIGAPHRDRLEQLVDQALGHLNQWTVAQNAPYVRPFMVALTANALINYYENIRQDSRIPQALAIAADWIWDHNWMPQNQAFSYTDRSIGNSDDLNPSPDLNLLIAPFYGWLYHRTGQERFQTRGDAIFAGGVRQAFLTNGKQFDQSYRYSFDFVKWRQAGPVR